MAVMKVLNFFFFFLDFLWVTEVNFPENSQSRDLV